MTFKPLSLQIKPVSCVLIAAYLPAILLLLLVALVNSITDIPVAHFTRDITAITGVAFYTGAISNIGIMLWCASASISFFAYAVLRKSSPDSKMIYYFLSAGFFTLILMFDDAFLFHERIASRYFGLSGNIIFIFYGLVGVVFFAYFRKIIFESDYVLFFTSFGFLAASILFDKVHDFHLYYILNIDSSGIKYLLEDGCKLMGITGWLGYLSLTCYGAFVKRN